MVAKTIEVHPGIGTTGNTNARLASFHSTYNTNITFGADIDTVTIIRRIVPVVITDNNSTGMAWLVARNNGDWFALLS